MQRFAEVSLTANHAEPTNETTYRRDVATSEKLQRKKHELTTIQKVREILWVKQSTTTGDETTERRCLGDCQITR